MKRIGLLLFVLCTWGISSLQAQSIFEKWGELKQFHGVMSQTFHPSEEGNLEPIKTRSKEMMEKAAILAKSKIPQEYQTKKILQAVKRLEKDSEALHQMIEQKASNESITKSLSALHDVFHEIVGLCRNEKH